MKLLDDGGSDSLRLQHLDLAVDGRRVDCGIADDGLLLEQLAFSRIDKNRSLRKKLWCRHIEINGTTQHADGKYQNNDTEAPSRQAGKRCQEIAWRYRRG